MFNQRIYIPNSVTHLTIGSMFNQKINIPNSVTHLKLTNTSKKIEIPNSITHLFFGRQFKKIKIYNKIPNKIIDLTYEHFDNMQYNFPYHINFIHNISFTSETLLIFNTFGNVHNLDLRFCKNLKDVNIFGNVNTLNLQHCNSITDVSALGNVHTLDLRELKINKYVRYQRIKI